MRIRLLPRIKPGSRASSALHILLNIFLVVLVVAIVIEPIAQPLLAVLLLILSKWRIVAVRPRHWPANIRANLVDVAVGVSIIVFMSGTSVLMTQLLWACFYIVWLVIIKPRSNTPMIMLQAMTAQTLSLVALFGTHSELPALTLVLLTWLICYSAARHFFSAFEEVDGRLMSHVWGIFGAELAWVLSHWTLSYGFLPQIALIVSVIGYAFAVCYYLHATRGLKSAVRSQFIIVTVLVVLVIALFSEWQYSGI